MSLKIVKAIKVMLMKQAAIHERNCKFEVNEVRDAIFSSNVLTDMQENNIDIVQGAV